MQLVRTSLQDFDPFTVQVAYYQLLRLIMRKQMMNHLGLRVDQAKSQSQKLQNWHKQTSKHVYHEQDTKQRRIATKL